MKHVLVFLALALIGCLVVAVGSQAENFSTWHAAQTVPAESGVAGSDTFFVTCNSETTYLTPDVYRVTRTDCPVGWTIYSTAIYRFKRKHESREDPAWTWMAAYQSFTNIGASDTVYVDSNDSTVFLYPWD